MFEQSIHGGKYQITRDARHRYSVINTKNGVIHKGIMNVTSVTGMLAKPQLIPWAMKIGCEVGVAAADSGWYGQGPNGIKAVYKRAEEEKARRMQTSTSRGSKIHAYLEAVIENEIHGQKFMEPKDKVLSAVKGEFDAWRNKHEVKFEAAERVLFHPERNYIGTTDVLLSVDGRPAILDFKTGGGVYPEYGIQLAAYAYAAAEEGLDLRDRLILHFDGKNEEKLRVYDEDQVQQLTGTSIEGDFAAFCACLELYTWKRGGSSAWELKKK